MVVRDGILPIRDIRHRKIAREVVNAVAKDGCTPRVGPSGKQMAANVAAVGAAKVDMLLLLGRSDSDLD